MKKNDDGTETVSYKLPYARMFVDHVSDYIAQYDAANPDAPMVYDYVPAKETIPWMEILFYLAMLGCTGFLLFSMMRGGGAGGGEAIRLVLMHQRQLGVLLAVQRLGRVVEQDVAGDLVDVLGGVPGGDREHLQGQQQQEVSGHGGSLRGATTGRPRR